MDDKENTAPLQLDPSAHAFSFSPVKKDVHKSRSKSIGPGGLDNTPALKARRQSNATVRGILPDKEDAERKAARRKSMANRRVSFAPEATLHTWDVIEYMRDHTNSTENTDGTRHTSADGNAYDSPSSQLASNDDVSMSGMSDDSEESGSEEDESDEGDEEEDDDATGTAMSLVSDADLTQNSAMSAGSSTSSSLDRNLRMAAQTAGTRGIEYDEYGDMSMEIVDQEITNAFQPWVEQTDERRGSAAFDQENMNPFINQKLAMIPEIGEQEDMSMDVTRAVGGILPAQLQSSPFAEIPMDLTQAIGGIKSPQRSGQKRDYATMDDTPRGTASPSTRSKRRQSAIMATQSNDDTGNWDETMDFTRAVGGISAHARFSDASFDGNEELSMELTTVIGGISGHYAGLHSGQAMPQPSSPFRVEVDPTIGHDDEQDLLVAEAARQSPTPRSKVASSGRKSSAKSHRSSTTHHHDGADSSPAQRRASRRLSAKSAAERSPSVRSNDEAAPLTPNVATPIADDERTPQPRRVTRSASRSPRHMKSPAAAEIVREQSTPKPQSPERQPRTPTTATTPTSTNPEQRTMVDAIKLMTTPRKEPLKAVTPKKTTPSPARRPRSALRSAQRQPAKSTPAAAHTMNDDLVKIAMQDEKKPQVHLQDFLDEAGIRFMDLTTSKRRLTTATTPSRLRNMNDESEEMDSSINLDDAIVAAACTEPELELFKHACHELKRYIDEGRTDIKALEAETFDNTPVLIQAYMAADRDQRNVIDAHMRDIKTHARLRSKEMWYGWRSNLVDDLMKALQTIAEDLLADDEVLQRKEELLREVLPPMLEQRSQKQAQAEDLLAAVDKASPEEKEELQAAREQLLAVDSALEERKRLLKELQDQLDAQNNRYEELDEVRNDCLLTIETIDKAKGSSASVSGDQIAKLNGAVMQLENDYEWTIQSASVDPLVVTMTYKSQLELFFHPLAFSQQSAGAPISLKHISKESPCTTRRFFLQLLQAYLHSIDQSTTEISDMLTLISSTWDFALQLVETGRLLAIEGPVKTRIQSDECLILDSMMLLPAVRTKICVSFKILVKPDGSECEVSHEPSVKVVYGEPYNEKGMSEFLKTHTEPGFENWSSAVQQLRRKLVQQGPKISPA